MLTLLISCCLSRVLASGHSLALGQGAITDDPKAQAHVLAISQTPLPNPFGTNPRLMIQFTPEDRIPVPKLSPKKFGESKEPFEFDFYVGGFAKVFAKGSYLCRFGVYEQERKPKNDVAYAVTQMLLRLWEYDRDHFGLDHSQQYKQGIVDVYLCWGGNPGGEQLFDSDPQITQGPPKVNTIYIYDLPSFSEPVEMAREVAHEYGHAALPPIGGFKTPEDWANGYLGERLFLTYLRDQLAKKILQPQDAMGASADELDRWVRKNVDPLVARAAATPPNLALLGSEGQDAMNAYMGLVLYCSQILPDSVFARSLLLVESPSAKDVPAAILMAVEEPDNFTLSIPSALVGKTIWIPVSKARVEGATVLNTKAGWAQIRPTAAAVKLINR